MTDATLAASAVGNDARQNEGHPGQNDQVADQLGRAGIDVPVCMRRREEMCADIDGQTGGEGDAADPHDGR